MIAVIFVFGPENIRDYSVHEVGKVVSFAVAGLQLQNFIGGSRGCQHIMLATGGSGRAAGASANKDGRCHNDAQSLVL